MSLRVQLNALFCCLWRNVEASSHKHFVIFSGNQHCHLLPATCHNLRHGGCGPPRTVLTTPARFRVNSTAVKKPDIGSESRFLPTPPAFDARLKGSRRSLAIVWHGKTRLVWLPDGDRQTHTHHCGCLREHGEHFATFCWSQARKYYYTTIELAKYSELHFN